MISIYSLTKIVAPSVTVGVANLITYLGFKIHSNKQVNYRNYKIQKHFQAVKERIIDNLIDSNETLMRKRYSVVENYFKSLGNKNKLQGTGAEALLAKWREIAPNGSQITLSDEKRTNFFQEIRYYCLINKGTDDIKLLVEISKLCSNELVNEKDFELSENK